MEISAPLTIRDVVRRHRVALPLSLGLALVATAGGMLLHADTWSGGWRGYLGASLLLACAAGALVASVVAVAGPVLAVITAPGASARLLYDAVKSSPVRLLLDALVVFAMAGSLLGSALLPISFFLRFRAAAAAAAAAASAATAAVGAAAGAGAAPASAPAAAAVPAFIAFARDFPSVTLFTYLAGFWAVTLLRESEFRQLLRWYQIFTRRSPALAAVFSYGALGLAGTWMLALPFCQRDVLQASLLTSFFVSFSALTTTGLSNVDITVQWNGLGQFVIMLLVLSGGLGIFLFWALVSTAGRQFRISPLGQRELVEDPELSTYVRRTIIFFASSIPVGAVLLALADHRSSGIGERIFRSVFHASSAFCNAGFTLDSSIGSFNHSYAYGLVMSLLVVVGGLGPAVILFPRSRHARVSVMTSAVLILSGALIFYVFSRGLAGNNFVLSIFQSIAARTAGFGWVDLGRLPDLGALWLMVLMFIGACPGGTGGGAKLTVFYVLGRAFGATGRGLSSDTKEGRESASESMEAFSIAGLFAMTALAGALVLGLVESQPGVAVLFEVVSALSTTGLSMDLTPKLSSLSLVLLVPIMLVGKVGPVLLLQAIFRGKVEADDFLERIKSGRVLIG